MYCPFGSSSYKERLRRGRIRGNSGDERPTECRTIKSTSRSRSRPDFHAKDRRDVWHKAPTKFRFFFLPGFWHKVLAKAWNRDIPIFGQKSVDVSVHCWTYFESVMRFSRENRGDVWHLSPGKFRFFPFPAFVTKDSAKVRRRNCYQRTLDF